MMSRGGSRRRSSFDDPNEEIEFETDFNPEEFINWLETVIDNIVSELTRLQRQNNDDIVDGRSPRLRDADEITIQLCDLCKLKHDVKAYTAKSGLRQASNYLNRKLG